MMRSMLIASALAFALVASASAQQTQTETFNPGPVQAEPQAPAQAEQQPAAPQIDYAAEAQKRFSDWKSRKRDCYIAAKLEENKVFKMDGDDFKISDYVWLHPEKYNANEVKKCLALK